MGSEPQSRCGHGAEIHRTLSGHDADHGLIRDPKRARPFRTPLVWVTAPIAILGCIYLFASLDHKSIILFLIWAAIGLLVYFGYSRSRSHVGLGRVDEVHEEDPDAPPQTVPPVILAEMARATTRSFGYGPDDLIEALRAAAGYRFFAVDEAQGQLAEVRGFAPEHPGANVLCVPPGREDLLRKLRDGGRV